MSIIEKVFGTHSERELKRIEPVVKKIEGYRDAMMKLTDEELRGKTAEFKKRVASIDFVENGIANTVAEVPANKVINAIPFYTRIWETKGTTVESQAVGMELAQQYIKDHNITTAWDETTCQNYGEYQSGDSYYQVWLEDEDSIRVKLNIMDKYGIGGVAEWKLGFEVDSIWDVIEEYMNLP